MRSQKYEVFEKLGQGTYGGVYKGRARDTGEFVALKVTSLEKNEGTPATSMREVALLKSLRGHRNIMKLIDVVHEDREFVIVFELCKEDLKNCIDSFRVAPFPNSHSAGNVGGVARGVGGGGGGDSAALVASRSSSRHHRRHPAPLPPLLACDLMRQMVCGVAFMHQHQVLHRDLKPQNILLTHDGVLKIADFGLARKFGVPVASYSSEIITLWYRPLDVLLGSTNYGPEVDVWSMGCIFAEMLSGEPFFKGKTSDDQIPTILQITGTPNDELIEKMILQSQLSSGDRLFNCAKYPRQDFSRLLPHASVNAIRLLEKLLDLDLDTRYTARQALREPYLAVLNVPGGGSASAHVLKDRRHGDHGSSHR